MGSSGSGICVITRPAFGILKQNGGECGMRDIENINPRDDGNERKFGSGWQG